MEDDFDAISITLMTLPAHRFMHIKNHESDGYFDFWDKQDKISGQDCDTITQILDTIQDKLDGEDPIRGQFSGQVMAGIYEKDGQKAEAYGVRLPADYTGPLPQPLLLLDVPQADYLIFEHGPFDYHSEGDTVCQLLQAVMESFSYDDLDFEPDHTPGRLSYYYFDPSRYAKYVLPIKPEGDENGGSLL